MKQTDFTKQLSEYVNITEYYDVAGDYLITKHLQEQRIADAIDGVKRRLGIDVKENVTVNYYLNDDKLDGVKLKQTKVEYNQTAIDGNDAPVFEEIDLPTTADEENTILKEYAVTRRAKRKYDTLKQAGADRIIDGETEVAGIAWKAKETAEALLTAVTIDDAEAFIDLQADKIKSLEGISDEQRNELYYYFTPKQCEIGTILKGRNGNLNEAVADIIPFQHNCVCNNFLNNVVYDLFTDVFPRYRDEEEAQIISQYNRFIHDLQRDIEKKWYNLQVANIDTQDKQPQVEAESPITQTVVLQEEYKKPQQHIYDNTKAGRTVFAPVTGDVEAGIIETADGQFEITVSRRNAKVEHAVLLDVIGGTGDLTPYEAGVANAIYSIIEAGNTSFTSKQVAKQLYQTEKPSPNQQGAITKSIERLSVKKIKIDYTEHLKQNGVDLESAGIDGVIKDRYFLPVEGTTLLMNNGTTTKGYDLIKYPPQLEYCKAVNQIIPVDNKVLNVPVYMSNETVVIRDKLLQHINAVYNPKSRINNNILINTLLNNAGLDVTELTRKKRKQCVDSILKMLEYWDNPELGDGAIKYGYALNYGNKRALESITINRKPKQ